MSTQAKTVVQAQPKTVEMMSSKGSVLQRTAVNAEPVNEVPSVVHEVLGMPGQPLDPHTKEFMESRFGHDFSGVRIHTDAKAAESTRAVNARAYAVGKDVAFGLGQYTPETLKGKHLLSHELTHVVQQRYAPVGNLQMAGGSANNVFEREADSIADYVVQPSVTTPALTTLSSSPAILRRKEGNEASAGDVDQIQAEAKVDANRIRTIFVEHDIRLNSDNESKIMTIVKNWADKPTTVTRTRATTFDLFIVALGNASFDVSHLLVSQNTTAFDQIYRRLEPENVEQVKTWVHTRGRAFKDAQPNKEVKFEVNKEDVVKGLEVAGDVAAAGAEAVGDIAGGAATLGLVIKWLAIDLPKLYYQVKSVIDFVETVRNLKVDDVKKLFTATGIADLMVKALFGEVQGLPAPEKEEESAEKNESNAEATGLVKFFNTVMKIIKAVKKAYSKVVGFVNGILNTIDITKYPWFKTFSMVYAGIVDAIEIARNPGAALGSAVAKIQELMGNFFGGLKTKVTETAADIKEQVEVIGNPAKLVTKLADKAIEMVLNFIITHPPSPILKLAVKIVEALAGDTIIGMLRKKLPNVVDEMIKKIAESDIVKNITQPLHEPVASLTGAITNVSTNAQETIAKVEGKVTGLVGDGVQMVKELTGIDPEKPKAADSTASPDEEKKAAKPAIKGSSLSDFFGVIKSGIHTRLLARGEQELLQAGKSLGKAALKKVTEGAKGIAGKLLGKKVGFEVGKAHHELWAEEADENVTFYMQSEKTAIDKKIEQYKKVFPNIKDQDAKKKSEKLLPQLVALNAKTNSLNKKDVKAIEATEQKMITLIEQLEQLMPATEFKTEFTVPSGATVRLTRDLVILVCDGTSCKEIDTYKNHSTKMKGVGLALNTHHLLEKRFLDSLDKRRKQRGIPTLNLNMDDVNSVVLPSRGKELDDLIKRYPAAQALKEIPYHHLVPRKLDSGTSNESRLSVSSELQRPVTGITKEFSNATDAVTAGEIFDAHADLYTTLGRPSWIQAIKGYFKGLL